MIWDGMVLVKSPILTGHVPHLDLVLQSAAQRPPTRRAVTVVLPVVEVRDVLELLLEGQLVEGLAQCELPVYLLLGDAKVGDVEEALRPDGLDKLLGQLLVPLVGTVGGEIDVGDCMRTRLVSSRDIFLPLLGFSSDLRSAQSRSSLVSGT